MTKATTIDGPFAHGRRFRIRIRKGGGVEYRSYSTEEEAAAELEKLKAALPSRGRRNYAEPCKPIDCFIPLPPGPLTCVACAQTVLPHQCARDRERAVCWACGGYVTLRELAAKAEVAAVLESVDGDVQSAAMLLARG